MGPPLSPPPPEVVIMEVDQGTPPPEVVIMQVDQGTPSPPPTEVVIMEVDQGTPPPIWTDHTTAIGGWFSFEKRISTCLQINVENTNTRRYDRVMQ